MKIWLRIIIFPVILQRSGSRATFLHFHRTIFTSLVLSSGLPAVLLPFPAVFIKNCTFLVYQPRVTLSSTIFSPEQKLQGQMAYPTQNKNNL
jgi:hypothetical protein